MYSTSYETFSPRMKVRIDTVQHTTDKTFQKFRVKYLYTAHLGGSASNSRTMDITPAKTDLSFSVKPSSSRLFDLCNAMPTMILFRETSNGLLAAAVQNNVAIWAAYRECRV